MIPKEPVPVVEQETLINVDYVDKFAFYYSCRPSVMKQIYKFLEEYPDQVTLDFEDKWGICVKIPKDWVKVKPPRAISEEQREAMRERMARVNEARREQETEE